MLSVGNEQAVAESVKSSICVKKQTKNSQILWNMFSSEPSVSAERRKGQED